MQQTNTYKLNLIEGTDDFLPDPLNENMEKLEEVIQTKLAEVTEAVGTGGSTCRIYWGSYKGTGTYGSSHKTSLTFPFRPLVIFLVDPTVATNTQSTLVRGQTSSPSVASGYILNLTWLEQGVQWYGSYQAESQANVSGRTYYYVAIGDNA